MRLRSPAILACLTMLLTATSAAPVDAPPVADQAGGPGLRVRAEIVSGFAAAGPARPSLVVENPGGQPLPAVPLAAGGWSPWIELAPLAPKLAALRPDGKPVVLALNFQAAAPADWASGAAARPLEVRAEVTGPGGRAWPLRGLLFGPKLSLLVWRDAAGALQAGTEADYDKRYWAGLAGPPTPSPRHIIVADRFIGADNDALAWRAGFSALRAAGANTLLVPPLAPLRPLLQQAGVPHIGWAVYAPEGKTRYIAQGDPAALPAWAAAQAKPYGAAGYGPDEMAIFALADEPGWYYPKMLDLIRRDPDILERFRAYLRAQGLAPRDVGAPDWSRVAPIGRSAVRDLPSRRLFYWSMRFAPADSARYFAHATAALEQAFRPGLPIFVNWNNFAGRLYVPGPVANNPDKSSPDAATGMQDWPEFGRARGATLLWTEDWFPDKAARQWSYYAVRLASAARSQQAPGTAEQFGGYIIPRMSSAETPDGIAQKAMALVGHGGKAVQYFWFGPEYNFPGNCYSETPGALAAIRRANGLIAAGEDLLWPGRPMRSPVAILTPRSAEMWDAQDQRLPIGVQDATNANLNRSTSDYMAEVADLFAALQDANIPVEFVSEDDLTATGLKPYRVLYVTEPDVPAEGQAAIAAWTRAGGVLATVANAATHDRYHTPFTALGPLTSPPRASAIVGAIDGVRFTAATGPSGAFQAAFPDLGGRPVAGATVLARLGDGSPAIQAAPMGRGEHIHFAFMPGLSYVRLSPSAARDGAGRAAALRGWIAYPIARAHVAPPVTASDSGVETPVLVSAKGAAVTVLNWRGAPLASLDLRLRLPFPVGSVESVTHGRLPFTQTPQGVAVHMPLKAVDVLMVRPAG
jgi:hypothetical protein